MPIPQWLQKYQADRKREVQTRNGSYYDPRRGVWVDTASGRPQPETGLLGSVGSQFRTGPVPAGEDLVTLGPTSAAEAAAVGGQGAYFDPQRGRWISGPVPPRIREFHEKAGREVEVLSARDAFSAQMARMGAVLPGSAGGVGSDPSKLTFTRDVNVRAGGDAERQAREGGPARYFSIAENEAAAQRAAWDLDKEPPGPGLIEPPPGAGAGDDFTPFVPDPPTPDTPLANLTAGDLADLLRLSDGRTTVGGSGLPPQRVSGLLGNVVSTGNPFADESLRLQTVRDPAAEQWLPTTGGGFPGRFPRQFAYGKYGAGPGGNIQQPYGVNLAEMGLGNRSVVRGLPARPIGPINRYTGPGPIGGGFNRPANLYIGPGGGSASRIAGFPPQWSGGAPPQPPVNRGKWQYGGGERGRLDFPEVLEGAAWAGGSALASVAAPWAIPAIVAANMEFGPWGGPKPSDAAQAGWDALSNWNRNQGGATRSQPWRRSQPHGPYRR